LDHRDFSLCLTVYFVPKAIWLVGVPDTVLAAAGLWLFCDNEGAVLAGRLP
jgi:hypothetical protein